jgi:tetratricopeptide (TPR) repeat protein
MVLSASGIRNMLFLFNVSIKMIEKIFSQAPGREAKMATISKIAGIVLVSALLAAGCQQQSKQKSGKISYTETDKRKAVLLNKIEKEYGDSEAHYKLGKLYHDDGLWNKAEWEFNVALGFDPVHRRAQAAMIKTLQAAGNEERAKVMAEIYLNQASSSAESSLLLGQAFQKELLDEYALDCYQQALGLAPNSAALYRQIGYYYLSKGDRVRAEENLKRSFQLDPYQAEVAGELGRMGVVVQIPRKTEKNTKKLDKLLDK